MKTALTHAEIRRAAEAVASDKLRRELRDLINAAEWCALDGTNHIENLSSLEGIAAFEEAFSSNLDLFAGERTVSKTALRWFSNRGIRT